MESSVGDLAGQWVRHRIRSAAITPLTGRNQRTHLSYFVAAHGGNNRLRADRRVFARWLESIGHLSANTRRQHVSTVRGFVRWAAVDGHIAQRASALIPPVRGIRAVPRALNSDQSTMLIHSLSTPRQRAVVGLMIWAGLRCAEVAGLNVQDINEREATMHVTGKGGHQRMLPIPPELQPFLTTWLDVRRRVPGPLIVNAKGGRYTPKTISSLVAMWMRTAGVKVSSRDGRSAHALRHTAASDVLDRGAKLTTVQQMLGHEHLATTAIYLRRAKLDELKEAMGGRNYAA